MHVCEHCYTQAQVPAHTWGHSCIQRHEHQCTQAHTRVDTHTQTPQRRARHMPSTPAWAGLLLLCLLVSPSTLLVTRADLLVTAGAAASPSNGDGMQDPANPRLALLLAPGAHPRKPGSETRLADPSLVPAQTRRASGTLCPVPPASLPTPVRAWCQSGSQEMHAATRWWEPASEANLRGTARKATLCCLLAGAPSLAP